MASSKSTGSTGSGFTVVISGICDMPVKNIASTLYEYTIHTFIRSFLNMCENPSVGLSFINRLWVCIFTANHVVTCAIVDLTVGSLSGRLRITEAVRK